LGLETPGKFGSLKIKEKNDVSRVNKRIRRKSSVILVMRKEKASAKK